MNSADAGTQKAEPSTNNAEADMQERDALSD